MNRDELLGTVITHISKAEDVTFSERVAIVESLMKFIDSYVASEIERVTLVTPEMLDKIEVYWLHNMDYAGELTKQLRERAKGE